MDLFVSTNMYSNGAPTAFHQDLDHLVSFLDRAEAIVTSGPSNVMARNNDYNRLNPFLLLEPTPIRPDHEMAIRKQDSLTKDNHPTSKTADPFCASVGPSISDLSRDMDLEPIDLRTAVLAPMVIGQLSKDRNFRPTNNHPFSVGKEQSPSQNHSDGSSPSVRLHKYQKCQWDIRFHELMAFRQEHNHLLVPHYYPPNQKLAQWVKRQRHQYKRKQMGQHSTLTDEREGQLASVGFIFDSHRAAWYTRFESLKAFFLANGHCGIPSKFEDGSLNVWIKHQRRQYLLFMNGEKSAMTEERIVALNSIGFNWNPRNFVRPQKQPI
ncbi:helicase domain protein [Nitzschia inconspicua]|uniref:Helicase domain protein n=1 Tax=Nitzschia inconspicua TaxID=303405 RepID=A0A9K3M241_9STRA|nr:helicase domain protein [Nitzschia inconspicua]